MIIGYNFLGQGLHGNFFDTAIPTSQIDEMLVGAGIYDELFITVDTDTTPNNVRPDKWQLKNIMHAKFQEDLEAGTLDADGHTINQIQVYRRQVGSAKGWMLIGRFDYDIDYNSYAFTDITAENGVTYEYGIVPVANEILGSMTTSDPIKVEYDGVFISDYKNNFKLELDFELEQMSYNRNTATMSPLNGTHPIILFGNQDYRTGSARFLPVTERQLKTGGTTIDGRSEAELRNSITSFLNNGQAKVLRNDNGEVFIVATTDVRSNPKSGRLQDLHEVEFSYTEIGKLVYSDLSRSGMLGGAIKYNMTFDESGEVIWEIV